MKPDDIPRDLMAIAESIAADLPSCVQEPSRGFAANVIARAILAERKAAAAKIAEHAEGERALQHAAREAKDRRDTLIHMYAAQGLEQLEAAIRKGSD